MVFFRLLLFFTVKLLSITRPGRFIAVRIRYKQVEIHHEILVFLPGIYCFIHQVKFHCICKKIKINNTIFVDNFIL